jgi:hypothetical protein
MEDESFGQLTTRTAPGTPRGIEIERAAASDANPDVEGNFLQRASSQFVKGVEHIVEEAMEGRVNDVAEKLTELGEVIETEGEKDLLSMAERSEQLLCERDGGLESLDLSTFQGRLDSFNSKWRGAATGRLVKSHLKRA